MSNLLSIAASGVRAYQTALTTVSENIANAGTAGYARRTAAVREVASAGTATNSLNGMGVTVLGVGRAADPVRSGAVRDANADLAKTETAATWMAQIETALTGNQLADSLTQFFTSAKGVAANASALPARAAMLEAASGVATAFSATGTALANAASDLDATAQAAVSHLNGLGAALARINSGIGRASGGTSGTAALLDQRDRLLEEMSALTDVSVTLDAAGRASVRVGGASGPALVEGETAATAAYARSGGAVALTVNANGEAHALSPSGGVLAGVVEGAQRIADAQDGVTALARDFAQGANAVQAAGQDLHGAAGAALFTIGDPASQLGLALTDPRAIAAAAPGGGARDNSNLAGFESLRSTGRVETGLSDMTAANASALAARKSIADAQGAIRDNAVSARDSVTGVNIDEEAVDLLRFQQAYQASSRAIQVARETLQSILDIR